VCQEYADTHLISTAARREAKGKRDEKERTHLLIRLLLVLRPRRLPRLLRRSPNPPISLNSPCLIHNLQQPLRDRHILKYNLQVVLVRVFVCPRGRVAERKVELSLETLEHDPFLLFAEFELGHVEEMGEDVAVVDEEVLLDRPARVASRFSFLFW